MAGKPLVSAVQDFHPLRAKSWSNTGLVEYLYGIRQVRQSTVDGSSSIVSEPIEEFVWHGKTIPAGFFSQPDTEKLVQLLRIQRERFPSLCEWDFWPASEIAEFA